MFAHSLCLIFTHTFLLPDVSLAARVLITTGFNNGSHFSVLSTVGRALVERGHTVTALISEAHREDLNDPRYSHLIFDVYRGRELELTRERPKLNAKNLAEKAASPFGSVLHWKPPNLSWLLRSCVDMVDHSDEKKYQYDLFLLDGHCPCCVFLAGHLGIPYVLLVPSGIKPSLARRHGISDTSTFYPEMTTGLPYRMGFFERVSNTINSILGDVKILFTYDLLGFLLSFKYNITSPVRNLLSSAQLVLINADFSMDFPFPLQPNVVAVGGLTTRPAKPLSKVSGNHFDGSLCFGVEYTPD